MDLRVSLASLDGVYDRLMAPNGGLDHIEPQVFAEAWEGARHFRDQTLLLLARYTFTAVGSNALPVDVAARRLVDFTFKYLPRRQVAFALDLAATLLDSEVFEDAVKAYAPISLFANEYNLRAVSVGLNGLYFYEPESLVNLEKSGSSEYAPAPPAPPASMPVPSAHEEAEPAGEELKPASLQGTSLFGVSVEPVVVPTPAPKVGAKPNRPAWLTSTDVATATNTNPRMKSLEHLGVSEFFSTVDAAGDLDSALYKVKKKLTGTPPETEKEA